MAPMPHAIASYREPSRFFEAYILSTSPWANPTVWSFLEAHRQPSE
jgi:hypothetical protein